MPHDCFYFVLDLNFGSSASIWIAYFYIKDGVWMFSFPTSHDESLFVGVVASLGVNVRG